MAFLNKDGNVATSARNDGNGKPITDVFIKGGGSEVKSVTFHDNTASPSEGTPFDVGYFKTINLKITGTSASRTIKFEAAGYDGVYEPVMGVRPKDFSMDVSSTDNNESWQFDVTGFSRFRARVESVVGGNVSIKGRVVS